MVQGKSKNFPGVSRRSGRVGDWKRGRRRNGGKKNQSMYPKRRNWTLTTRLVECHLKLPKQRGLGKKPPGRGVKLANKIAQIVQTANPWGRGPEANPKKKGTTQSNLAQDERGRVMGRG